MSGKKYNAVFSPDGIICSIYGAKKIQGPITLKLKIAIHFQIESCAKGSFNNYIDKKRELGRVSGKSTEVDIVHTYVKCPFLYTREG